jgi:predicted phosphodiesterase
VRIVCISDTHLQWKPVDQIPEGDVLIHAGDLTMTGSYLEVVRACATLSRFPHPRKLLIAGNHDALFQTRPGDAKVAVGDAITYLEDSGVEIGGLRFWGSPWTPRYYDWSFQLERKRPESERPFLLRDRGQVMALDASGRPTLRWAEDHWKQIPQDTDVLITHGPPYGILDKAGYDLASKTDLHVGDEALLDVVKQIRPRVHVFGHIHSSPGQVEQDGTIFVNATMCDESYRWLRKPIVIDLD